MKKTATVLVILFAACMSITAQTKQNQKKLTISNATNGVVYYDEHAVLYADQKYAHNDYIVEIHFSNPITKIEKKEPIALKFDNKPNKSYVLLDYYFVSIYAQAGNMEKQIQLDTVVTFSCWDSLSTKADVNNPGKFVKSTEVKYFRINDGKIPYKAMQLHIPAGTFTDIFGNKNEDTNLTFQKRKK